jgi:drug/metabolite transporter (DMT)-like permease
MQFLFNQQFRKRNGDGIDSTFTFSLYTHGISFLILFALNKFHLEINWFTFIVALIYALVVLGYAYSGLKSFATANLSVYSIFAMLGGMLLPSAYGIIFFKEELSVSKIICLVLIIVSTALSFEKSTTKGNNLKYYLGVFVLNGMVGVLSKIHQSDSSLAVDSKSFMATVNIFVFVICLAYQLIKNKKIAMPSLKAFGSIGAHAFCNGIGNLLCLIALVSLPASVQFPITTGGVMVFSTIISLIRKEKPSPKTLISTAIAFVSTVLMMF